jgi:Zn-finger nucleic acid-binding protein
MEYSENCPACGFTTQQEFDTCPKCGVIIEKYYAKQSERMRREAEKEQYQRDQTEHANRTTESREADAKSLTDAPETKKSPRIRNIFIIIGAIVIFCVASKLISSSLLLLMIPLSFGAGSVIALCLMMWGTLNKQRTERIVLSISSMAVLLLQKGCWQFEDGINIATNSMDRTKIINIHTNIIVISILVCVIWAVIIIATGKPSIKTHKENN